MKKNWVIEKENPKLIEKICKSLDLTPITAQVLINRGIKSEFEAEQFLKSSLFDLPSPFLMKDMQLAVERIILAINKKETICIYGDYDVDGITATALLYTFLKDLGCRVTYYNPDRIKEGYGVHVEAVKKLKKEGVSLIISGDCGITACLEVDEAKKLGVDFIITDHHEPPDKIPNAEAVLNPHQKGCNYPGKEITGVGVIFNLAIALRRVLRESGFFKKDEPNLGDFLDLVALGTVSDCASLSYVNRIFVKEGIKRLSNPKRPGMLALKEKSSLSGDVTAFDLGFKIGPRVNASGRLNSAGIAVELLISEDIEKAKELALTLDRENSKRQAIEHSIMQDAISQIESNPKIQSLNSIVLSSPNWHQGVIGIVASRIVERYRKPAVLISILDTGLGKGSARSLEHINIHGALSECRDLFEEFGGHELAAGLTIKEENIDEFQKRLDEAISKSQVNSISNLRIDCALNLSEINEKLVSELELLSPYGLGNPEPLFLAKSINVISGRIFKGKHMSLNLMNNGHTLNAIWFNIREPIDIPKKIDIVFTPVFNNWNGKREIRLNIKDAAW